MTTTAAHAAADRSASGVADFTGVLLDATAADAANVAARAVGAADADDFADITVDALGSAARAAGAAAHATDPAAARAAARAVGTAAATDATIAPDVMFSQPIWHEPREPDWLVKALRGRSNLLESGPEWSFWRDWYQGFLIGKPLDWELQKEVALIPDAEWEKGPEHIAGLIEEIRKEHDRKPLDQAKLASHVEQLVRNPVSTAITAKGTAELIEQAIGTFLREAPANELPDELIILRDIPQIFRTMATTVSRDEPASEREKKLQAEINHLHGKVSALEAELELAKENALTGTFKNAWVESLGKTFGSAWFLGAVCLGTAHFFGVSPSEITYENLRAWLDSYFRESPSAAPPGWQGQADV